MEKYNIGNYLKAERGNFISPGMVDNHYLSDHGICQMTAKGLVLLEETKIEVVPIKLTENWLKSFSFMVVSTFLFKKFNFDIYLRFNSSYDVYYKGHLIGSYHYVHELQDIFCSITKKALIFNGSL